MRIPDFTIDLFGNNVSENEFNAIQRILHPLPFGFVLARAAVSNLYFSFWIGKGKSFFFLCRNGIMQGRYLFSNSTIRLRGITKKFHAFALGEFTPKFKTQT